MRQPAATQMATESLLLLAAPSFLLLRSDGSASYTAAVLGVLAAVANPVDLCAASAASPQSAHARACHCARGRRGDRRIAPIAAARATGGGAGK